MGNSVSSGPFFSSITEICSLQETLGLCKLPRQNKQVLAFKYLPGKGLPESVKAGEDIEKVVGAIGLLQVLQLLQLLQGVLHLRACPPSQESSSMASHCHPPRRATLKNLNLLAATSDWAQLLSWIELCVWMAVFAGETKGVVSKTRMKVKVQTPRKQLRSCTPNN